MTPIGIAVVEHNGRFLVGKRGNAVPLAGLAEFPGGKCESTESPRDCAVRECFEEAGLAIDAVELLLRRTFDYSHDRVELHFWLCRPRDPALPAQGGFGWVPIEELGLLEFPPANEPLVKMLLERFG